MWTEIIIVAAGAAVLFLNLKKKEIARTKMEEGTPPQSIADTAPQLPPEQEIIQSILDAGVGGGGVGGEGGAPFDVPLASVSISIPPVPLPNRIGGGTDLYGLVSDSTGKPLTGASISITSSEGSGRGSYHSTATNGKGVYTFSNISPGTYSIKFQWTTPGTSSNRPGTYYYIDIPPELINVVGAKANRFDKVVGLIKGFITGYTGEHPYEGQEGFDPNVDY